MNAWRWFDSGTGFEIALEPMPGKIAVQVSTEHVTNSNLVLLRDPANSRVGEVVAAYEPFKLKKDEEDTEPYVQVGDHVVFGRHSGVEVAIGRFKITILKEGEILTKLYMRKKATNGSQDQ